MDFVVATFVYRAGVAERHGEDSLANEFVDAINAGDHSMAFSFSQKLVNNSG
jgi:hypothetical protein